MSESGRIRIREIKPINIEGGFLVDGFPSIGFTSAIATESLIHTSQFELGGIIDSDNFPPVTIIKDGIPNYPTRIFFNKDLKVAVFSSYLTLHESLHRTMALQMLEWAKKHKCSLIVSSVAVKVPTDENKAVAAGSTDSAKKKLKEAGFSVLQHGTIPGIPGTLLNDKQLAKHWNQIRVYRWFLYRPSRASERTVIFRDSLPRSGRRRAVGVTIGEGS